MQITTNPAYSTADNILWDDKMQPPTENNDGVNGGEVDDVTQGTESTLVDCSGSFDLPPNLDNDTMQKNATHTVPVMNKDEDTDDHDDDDDDDDTDEKMRLLPLS